MLGQRGGRGREEAERTVNVVLNVHKNHETC